jgi:hypothetical protein
MAGVGTTHDVKIGDIYCRLAPGGYRRRQAPLRGARVSSGDHSYTELNIWQAWNQHCWAGGIGADKWIDDSMYDSGVGIDTTLHEQASLSRDLTRCTDGNLDADSRGKEREFIIYKKTNGNKRLYCLTKPEASDGVAAKLWKYTYATNSWALAHTFPLNQVATCIVSHSGELAVGFDNGKIKSNINPDNTATWTNRAPPKGENNGVTAMKRYRQRLYVAYGRTVYRRKWDWSVDGKTEFYDPQGGGAIVTFETHLGFLYMGSRGGHIHRTDGNNTFDLWSWDGGTEVSAMRSFDGRLFISTYEFNDDKTLGVGGIYQMTGSAVTQLKKWGEIDRSTVVGKFRVYDRKLYYGASGLWSMNKNSAGTDLEGFGIAVYDPIEDAHSIWASNKDTITYTDTSGTGADFIVDDVIYYRGRMLASVRQHGIFSSTVTYRDYLTGTVNYDTTTTAATGSANNGFLVSSEYDGGTPGLKKLWRMAEIEAFLPSNNVDVTLQYSTDRGETWTELGTLQRTLTGTLDTTISTATVDGTGTAFREEVSQGDELNIQGEVLTIQSVDSDTQLTMTSNAASTVNGTAYGTKKDWRRKWYMSTTAAEVIASRMQYRLVANSSSGTETPTIQSVTFWYLPEPEPNWIWDLSVYVVDSMELLDSTYDAQSITTQLDTIAGYFRDQKIINYTDREGKTWDSLIWDYVEDYHVPGVASEPEEAMLRLTILEVADD